MDVTIIPWTAEASCHRCADTEIHAVCHHCGRPMCRDDTPEPFDLQGRLLSHEHLALGLERSPCSETPIHCEDCFHLVRPPRPGVMLPGAVAFVAGRFLQQEMPAEGLVVVLLGLFGLAMGGALFAWRWWGLRRDRPWVPWVPRLRRLAVVETVSGRLELDSEGRYCGETACATGSVTFEATLGEAERYVLECYQRKFRLSGRPDLPFRAGFLALTERASLVFEEDATVSPASPHVLRLEGRTTEEAARQAIGASAQGDWSREWRYRIGAVADCHVRLPLQVVPYLLPESGGRRLGLELRWDRKGDERRPRGPARPAVSPLEPALVEELEVMFPLEWGEIEVVDARVVQTIDGSRPGEPRRRVSWRKVVLQPEDTAKGYRRFEVRLDRPADLSARLDGQVSVELKGGRSGIGEVSWFHPSGEPAGERATTVTRVDASFALSLGSLRHREVRLVPDAKRPEEQDLVKPIRIDGVVPDHATIIALGRALVAHGYYLKSVVEDRPRTGASPTTVRRIWDMAGRIDGQIHPTEFHISLSGEELTAGTSQRGRGTTSVTVTVHGTFSNEPQEEAVKSRWEGLRHLVARTLRAPVPAGPPADAARHPAAAAPLSATAGAPGPPVLPIPTGGDLERLRELLLAGRISEETYRELRREIAPEPAANVVPIDRRGEAER